MVRGPTHGGISQSIEAPKVGARAGQDQAVLNYTFGDLWIGGAAEARQDLRAKLLITIQLSGLNEHGDQPMVVDIGPRCFFNPLVKVRPRFPPASLAGKPTCRIITGRTSK